MSRHARPIVCLLIVSLLLCSRIARTDNLEILLEIRSWAKYWTQITAEVLKGNSIFMVIDGKQALFHIFLSIGIRNVFTPADHLQDESASTQNISERSLLGVAPGALVPIPSGVKSCSNPKSATFDSCLVSLSLSRPTRASVCTAATLSQVPLRQYRARHLLPEAWGQSVWLQTHPDSSSLYQTTGRTTSRFFR